MHLCPPTPPVGNLAAARLITHPVSALVRILGVWMESNDERGSVRDRRQAESDDQPSSTPLHLFEHEVDQASTLVREAVERISRRCPEHQTGEVTLEDLQRMRPRFEGALTALAEIERRRRLTQKDLSRRRAFKMLLEGTRKR